MMRLGSVFGFPVFAQSSFLFLVALYVLPGVRTAGGLQSGLIAATVVTLSILVHELGHAFAFRAFGERDVAIVLWGFGGLTYGKNPARAWKSVVVSLAGPAVGFVVGIAALVARIGLGPHLDPRLADVLDLVVRINLLWTFFNLLPLHPLDGGQALRTFLVAWKGAPGLKASLVLSIVTAVLVGVAAYPLGYIFVSLVSAMLLFRNVRELRGERTSEPHPGE